MPVTDLLNQYLLSPPAERSPEPAPRVAHRDAEPASAPASARSDYQQRLDRSLKEPKPRDRTPPPQESRPAALPPEREPPRPAEAAEPAKPAVRAEPARGSGPATPAVPAGASEERENVQEQTAVTAATASSSEAAPVEVGNDEPAENEALETAVEFDLDLTAREGTPPATLQLFAPPPAGDAETAGQTGAALADDPAPGGEISESSAVQLKLFDPEALQPPASLNQAFAAAAPAASQPAPTQTIPSTSQHSAPVAPNPALDGVPETLTGGTQIPPDQITAQPNVETTAPVPATDATSNAQPSEPVATAPQMSTTPVDDSDAAEAAVLKLDTEPSQPSSSSATQPAAAAPPPLTSETHPATHGLRPASSPPLSVSASATSIEPSSDATNEPSAEDAPVQELQPQSRPNTGANSTAGAATATDALPATTNPIAPPTPPSGTSARKAGRREDSARSSGPDSQPTAFNTLANPPAATFAAATATPAVSPAAVVAAVVETATPAAPRVESPEVAVLGNRRDAAPTTATSRSTAAPPEVNRSEFLQRVVDAVQQSVQDGRQLRVRLNPPELGSLQIEISLRGGLLSARLEVQTASAQQALLENMPMLRDALAQHGTTLDRVDVQLSNPQHEESSSDSGRRQGQTDDGEPRQQRQQQRRNSEQQSPRDEPQRPAAVPSATGVDELDIAI